MFSASFIFNFLNRQLGVVLSLSGMGAALYLTPHCPTIGFLYAVTALLGLSNGIYNVSQTVWVIEMWEGEAGPWIQGAHFSYAVGTLIPSLLLGPFLTKESDDENGSTTAMPPKNERMWIPFTVVGIIVTIAVVIQSYLFAFQRYVPLLESEQLDLERSNNNIQSKDPDKLESTPPRKEMNPKYLKWTLIVLSAKFLGFYSGMEMVSFQFISIFAQFGELGFSESQGAQVITALTGSYAVGRGVGIFAILKIPPQFMLGVNLIILFAASIVLLVIGNSTVGLWVGVCLLGIGYSTVNPSFCAYIARHLKFTNAIGSLMIVSGSVVGAIFPIVIGKQIEENPTVLTYVNLLSTSLITVAILIILKLTYSRNKTLSKMV